jgi:hypothetical protein
MDDSSALGMVLATLVDGRGKIARGGKGQLYASREGLVVLKPTARYEWLTRITNAALLLSIVIVIGNFFTLKEPSALFVAFALQAIYWFSLPARRRALDPEPLAGAAFTEQAKKRVLFQVPAGNIAGCVPPEPPKRGFRKPARFLLVDGALEVYLSEEQFRQALAALGRER